MTAVSADAHRPGGRGKSAAIAFALTLPLALSMAWPAAQARGDTLPTLTTARAVHQLTMAEARRGYPIRLRATVAYYDPYLDYPQPILMVSDETGSVYVKLPLKATLDLKAAGQLVQVLGHSIPGGFAPDVGGPQVLVIGQSELPRTAPLRTLTSLLTGAEDAPFVEMEGVVHTAQESAHNLTLKIAGSDGVFTAVTPKVEGFDYARLVDARVRIRGLACSLFTRRRQIVGVQLRFAGIAMLKVVSPSPGSPFDLPATPVGSLLSYAPGKPFDRLVHLHGVVTLFWPGRLLCILDGADGLCAQTAETGRLAPGQIVDIAGFPQSGNYTPTLVDSTYRPGAGSAPGTALRVGPEQALSGEHDAQLVQIEGRLIGQDKGADDPSIVLSSGKSTFLASLPSSSGAEDMLRLQTGSKLRITGICAVQANLGGATDHDGYKVVKSFRILLRSSRDLVVLERPSWWNAEHTLGVLIVALVFISCALAWVLILRRRLRKQTELLQFQSTHDGLTGLWNRKAILELLGRECERAAQFHTGIGIMMLDADHFKSINDTYGHLAGDTVLRAISDRICQGVRSTDLVGRYGGEEFLVVLPDGEQHQICTIAERVRLGVAEKPVRVAETDLLITISAGVSILEPFVHREREAALIAADNALYASKNSGRNRVTFERPGNQPDSRELTQSWF